VHGILALLSVTFVALGTAFARRRSARQEMLAGWACGVTLATSIGGLVLAVLAARNGVTSDDAAGSVLADFAGQGLLCATAAWTAWRATAPEPRRVTKAASATN
jgi:drug/metabolite transporter (DMT)-like permease